jgi:hypothetical protein
MSIFAHTSIVSVGIHFLQHGFLEVMSISSIHGSIEMGRVRIRFAGGKCNGVFCSSLSFVILNCIGII